MESNDKKIEIIYEKMMAKKTCQEKVLMGFSMFGFSSRFLLNSFKDKIPPKKLKESVFLRLYKNDFDEDQQKRILKYL